MDCDFMAGRVLSVQSHVVSGYVGNKSATFPLQILGFEVDVINSVQFSNHTGYDYCKGQVLDSEQLEELILGLRLNKILHYTHLLTGYIGNASFLRKVVDLAKELKTVNPELIYVCDPVLGDDGKLYVPAELLPIYQKDILPVANIITPNQMEAELLTDMKMVSEEDAWKIVNKLHSMGPETVILTSSQNVQPNVLIGFASTRKGKKPLKVRFEIPKIPSTFTGAGDLFAACFLAWFTKTNGELKVAIEKTVTTLQVVLHRTLECAKDGDKSAANMELKLIQSKHDIENPKNTFQATIVA